MFLCDSNCGLHLTIFDTPQEVKVAHPHDMLRSQYFPYQRVLSLIFTNLGTPKKSETPKDEEKTQKKRVKKDPNAPKKPMPPFFCY